MVEGERPRRRRHLEPALLLLLACLVALGVAGAASLQSAQAASDRTVATDRLALAYADAERHLLQVELERHEILASDLQDNGLAAHVDEAGRRLQALFALDAEGHAAEAADTLAEFAGYRMAVLAGADAPADRGFEDLLTRLEARAAGHRQNALAAQSGLISRLATLQVGLAALVVLTGVAGGIATRGLLQRRRALETLAEESGHASRHDALTGLANRVLLSEHLAAALQGMDDRDQSVALLWLDLDNFKVVNDTLGHETGDLLLQEVATRMCATVRPDDLVARFGGDEFVVLCERLPSPAVAVQVAERLVDELRRPLIAGSSQHVLGASVGVALSPASSATAMLSAADTAMYRAKESGRSRVVVFNEAMGEADRVRLALGDQLSTAAERGELRLHYQPLVDLSSGQVVGVEALVRWQHPERGLLMPGAFLPLAEENGAIMSIGEWVVQEAVRTLEAWRSSDEPGLRSLRMSVNLAARQLTERSVVPLVAGALSRHRVDPSLLCLEVTESAVMTDVDRAIEALESLRSLGVRIAIDDFGTGYSSLSYLKQFPVHQLKLDRSFVAGVGTDARDSSIVAAVVGLCAAVDLTLVAEGVETERHRDLLRALGCQIGQGYLWSKPLPEDQLALWLRTRRDAAAAPLPGLSYLRRPS